MTAIEMFAAGYNDAAGFNAMELQALANEAVILVASAIQADSYDAKCLLAYSKGILFAAKR